MMRRAHWLLVAAAVIALAAYPLGVLHSRRRREAAEAERADQSAIATLIVILSAQATFHKTDHYGLGKLVYANARDGRGFRDLYEIPQADGQMKHLGYIDLETAEAIDAGHAIRGYYFVEVTGDENGPFDPATDLALCMIPSPYCPGKKTHYMGPDGTIWSRDTGGKLPPEYTSPSVKRADP